MNSRSGGTLEVLFTCALVCVSTILLGKMDSFLCKLARKNVYTNIVLLSIRYSKTVSSFCKFFCSVV